MTCRASRKSCAPKYCNTTCLISFKLPDHISQGVGTLSVAIDEIPQPREERLVAHRSTQPFGVGKEPFGQVDAGHGGAVAAPVAARWLTAFFEWQARTQGGEA